ncbi:hypothetical protein FOZ63_015118, partial [Perkinsus olseni]
GVPGKKRAATGNLSSGPLKRSRRQPKSRIEPKLAGRPPPPGIYHNVFPILVFTKVTMNLTTDLECQFKFWIPGLATPVLVGPHRIVASLLDDCYKFDHRDNVAIGRTTLAFRHLSDELARRNLSRIYMNNVEVRASSSEQVDLVIGAIRYPMRPSEAPAGLVRGSAAKAALKLFLQDRRKQNYDGTDLQPFDAGANLQPLGDLTRELKDSPSSMQMDSIGNAVKYPIRPSEAAETDVPRRDAAVRVPGSTKAALKSFLQNRGYKSDGGTDLRPLDPGGNHQTLVGLMQESEASYPADDILDG